MRDNFGKALKRTLRYEGGLVDDPHDPGGRTAYGVTQRVYDAWRLVNRKPQRDVWKIEPDEVEAIYQHNYWHPVRGDDLRAAVDLTMFDFAVNSGVTRAVKAYQRAVGVTEDGHFGVVTLAAGRTVPAKELAHRINTLRLNFLKALPHWARYGKGWSARVADLDKAVDSEG